MPLSFSDGFTEWWRGRQDHSILAERIGAVRGMSLRNTSLGSNFVSVTDLKRIETPNSLCCDFGGDKSFTTRWSGGRVQVWVQVWAPAGNVAISRRLFQKKIEGLEGKIDGRAHGAALRLCLRGLDARAQSQGVSESAAVAAGSYRLAWRKHATTLATLTQFKSQQSLNAL